MTSMDQLLPSMKDYFPGKPLATDQGDAFILDLQGDGTYTIQYAKGGQK
jgi:hypothetical protein